MALYNAVKPLLFAIDSEVAHEATLALARLAQRTEIPLLLLRRLLEVHSEPALSVLGALGVRVFGLSFRSPLGLAAGVDKNAGHVRFFAALGFGFVEVGSVSAKPAPGNQRPRAFRLPADHALVNRMGLPNEGAEEVARRLCALRAREHKWDIPLGVNLAKTPDPKILGEEAVRDFCQSYRALSPYCEYITLNISCPNTEDGRTFTDPEALLGLLSAIGEVRRQMGCTRPLLLKVPPPGAEGVDSRVYGPIVELSLSYGVSGLVVCNTAPDRVGLVSDPAQIAAIGNGGLSGRPLCQRALRLTSYLYKATSGRLPIVGVGGIDSAETAYERLRKGASLLQIYTGLVYEGPTLVRRIHEGLLQFLERDGVKNIAEVVGVDV